MADETKRVIDQTTDSSLSAGDFIIVDSQSEGTRKFDLGTELTDIKQDLEELQNDAGVTAELKQALLQLASKVAYIDDDGQDYYDDLYDALYPNAQSVTCVYTQTGTVYTTDTLDSLKDDLVVTAHYSDSTTKVLKPSDYTLTGTLTAGASTITVHYGDLTTTFTVTVTERTLSSISAVYTQSGTVYNTDSLDSLKSDLVVTAIYNDSSTETVSSSDYTLSGTLASGTSTITVSYEEKTTTFTVAVTATLYPLESGSYTFATSKETITVSNGNHLKVEYPSTYSGTGNITNITDLSKNGANSASNTAAVNNLTNTLFEIPSGASVVFSIENITKSREEVVDDSTSSTQFAIGSRRTGTSTSAFSNTIGYINDGTNRLSINEIVDSAINLSCLMLYTQRLHKPLTVEFDLSLIVNGVKWI